MGLVEDERRRKKRREERGERRKLAVVDLKYVETKHQRAGPELQQGKSCDLSAAPLCRELLPAVAEAAETCGNEGSLACFFGVNFQCDAIN